jgi:uncharacterized protein YgiM (DUF1202 family)
MPKIAFATMLLAGSFAAGVALADDPTTTLQKDVAVVIQPGVGAKAGALDAGTQVTVIDTNGEWTHIQTGSGVDGWVPTGALRQ